MMPEQLSYPDSVFFGDILYPPGATYGPRVQQKLQFVMIYRGSMTVWIDEKRYFDGENTVSLLFPGHWEYFEFARDGQTHHGWVDLFLNPIPENLYTLLKSVPRSLPLSSTMTQLVRLGLKLQTARYSTSGTILKLLALQILWLYVGEGEQQRSSHSVSSLHPALEGLREFIDLNLHEPLTLETLAKAASVSPGHLIRLFKMEYNRTPMDYVWERRVNTGIEFLKHTGLPVNLIASRCGFRSSNHFSRRVQQATGCSPIELRRKSWMGL